MQKQIRLVLSPEEASNEVEYKNLLSNNLKIDADRITFFEVLKKSIDARKSVKINIEFFVVFDEEAPEKEVFKPNYQDVSNKKEILIIGSGPAGLFAALKLIELGYKPIILERGKDVRNRRFDIAAINRGHIVNPDSNYCFGEGGAGTFSDGKLYTRSKKKGSVRKK